MKIACLLGQGFEDTEFQKPYEEFKKAGHEVVVIGIEANQELKGDKGKVNFTTERGIKDVRPEEFQALLIPGGNSPDKLRANDNMVQFTHSMFNQNKPVFAICHGPQLLLTADCHKNRTMTAWKTIQGDLSKAGADVKNEPVVVDRNLVTSRMPDDITQFVEESLAMMESTGGLQRGAA